MGAQAQHHVGRALGVLLKAAVESLHHNGHHLAARIERSLAHARMLLAKAGQARLGGIVYQRALGGLAHGLAGLGIPLGIGAQRHAGEELGLGRGELVLDHGHLVLGERARLIGANHLRAAERLHGGELADNRLAAGHLGHTERKHDGDHGHQTLGDGGDSKRHGNHKGVEQGRGVTHHVAHAVAQDVHTKDNHADHDNHDGEDAAELGELNLQGRELLLGLGQGAGDLAHLGVHAGAAHHGTSAAVHHGGAHVAHVLAVAQGHIVCACGKGDGLGMLIDRHGLARKRGLLDLHAGALEHAAVSRNRVTCLKQHDVARYQLGAGQVHEFAVTNHLGLRGAHLLQGGQSLLAFGLLHHAENRVHDHDEHDDRHIGKVGLALHHAGERTDDGGHDEHDHHGIGHLLEEANPQRSLGLLRQLVGAVLARATRGLGGG